MIVSFKGCTPQVNETAFVAENATLIGDLTIGAKSSVWFGAVIRGDVAPIRIGEGSNVQDNCVLHCEPDHPMRIGDNVTVGHGAIVHCSEIGDNVLVGMGAILLDGAVIGKNSIVGAGAVVKENAVIPENSLVVGIPGKSVRSIEGEQLALLQKESHYVSLAKEYRE